MNVPWSSHWYDDHHRVQVGVDEAGAPVRWTGYRDGKGLLSGLIVGPSDWPEGCSTSFGAS